jgi:AcrR family transcriptional regulator
VTSTDARTRSTDRRIYAASLRLLRAGGPRRVTVEAVAAESGVAKTTIYRRHADRYEMLAAALDQVPAVPRPGPGEDLAGLVRLELHRFARSVDRTIGRGVIAALLVEDDEAMSRLMRERLIEPYLAPFFEMAEVAVELGILRPDANTDLMVEMVLGSAFAEIVRFGTVRPEWAESLYELIVNPVVREQAMGWMQAEGRTTA